MSHGQISSELSLIRFEDENTVVQNMLEKLALNPEQRLRIFNETCTTVETLRNDQSLDLLEEFLSEYGLSTDEGIALMCLAEAFLRTPDESSLDALIKDKIGSGHWEQHLGTARSFLINASSWGLMLTGKLLGTNADTHEDISNTLQNLVRRLSEPAIRKAVEQVMKILGRQFVLGRSIEEAMKRARKNEKTGYTHSYDMLGEAALTAKDASAYLLSYSTAITNIAKAADNDSALLNPGISVKLSALHPRYETVQINRVLKELVPKVASLAQLAHSANIGFTIDAEESERLEISLIVIEEVLKNPTLKDWDGFGVVVQAYAKQAPVVIDHLYELANDLDRIITVRLVKGAYWDYEIKNAQLQGLDNYPVYTRKTSTDVSYLFCAEKLLKMTHRIYPQFATHNASTTSSILEIAGNETHFEFQRLHGMGEALHELIRNHTGKSSRIYAPVGVHKDLLAYLVRRLLENGANSSFIHQLHDETVDASIIAADPVQVTIETTPVANPAIRLPQDMFKEQRRNSRGISLNIPMSASELEHKMHKFKNNTWISKPADCVDAEGLIETSIHNPATGTKIGNAFHCREQHVKQAIEASKAAFVEWNNRTANERADIIDNIADSFENNIAEFMALATLEAGKTRLDGIQEVREAVDFCRFYAAEARNHFGTETATAHGPIVCISPWNFPLAIFTGQVVAALVTGNTVLAKPAEQTPLIAGLAVDLMIKSGVPEAALILLPGTGTEVGSALTSSGQVAGVCFTGSTATATAIDRSIAQSSNPNKPLIAETGGINAMLVDSTALPEQAVKHIVSSAFQSAGQRCSALRLLIVQEDVFDAITEMLEGAAKELTIEDPWQAHVDVGPIIDTAALKNITDHCGKLEDNGQLLFKVPLPNDIPQGSFVSPAAFRIDNFEQLNREIFGPVLHILKYKEDQLDTMIEKINASGYGLTLGIQSRIDERINRVCSSAKVGNIYVNRNQIGAVVGVQPFGGEGKSGTGPKAGGPLYIQRFSKQPRTPLAFLEHATPESLDSISWTNHRHRRSVLTDIASKLPQDLSLLISDCLKRNIEYTDDSVDLVGPTGETNTLSLHPRGTVLCLGEQSDDIKPLLKQITISLLAGNLVLLDKSVDTTVLGSAFTDLPAGSISVSEIDVLDTLSNSDFDAVAFDNNSDGEFTIRRTLAARDGTRIPILTSEEPIYRYCAERVISVDTTASGGNASLLSI